MRKYFLLLVLIAFAPDLIGQDDYHTKLLESLQSQYALENPALMLGETEIAIHEDLIIYGAESMTNQISDQSFTLARTIAVTAPGDNQWDAGINIRNQTAVTAGDKVLITFWAKQNSSSSEMHVFAEDVTTFAKEIYLIFNLTSEWKQYFFPFECGSSFAAESMTLGFHIANQAQNLDLAGFTALNYGSAYELEQFPSSFGGGSYIGSEADAPWRATAADRIEQLRKANLAILVKDGQGNPVEGAQVQVNMEKHAFGFGSAIVTCRMPGNRCFDANYISKITDLDGRGHGFNVGVTENSLKWDGWEEEWIGTPEETVAAITWLDEQGIEMRGHTLIWPGFNNMPDDINQNQTDLNYVRNRVLDRVESMITHPQLSPVIREWDVLNEITQVRDLERVFDADPDLSNGREIYQEIIGRVRELDPDVSLYMNDYIVLSGGGGSSGIINRYKGYLSEIQGSNVDFDGIGFQCHIGTSPVGIPRIEEVFDDFFTTYGKPFKVTEFDLSDQLSDEVQASYMADFLTMIFSHPAVEAFLMWGFWDGNHWLGNAPIFDIDWNVKPSGQAFLDLVFDAWWTSENSTTAIDGIANFRAFKGEHEINVTVGDQIYTEHVTLTDDLQVEVAIEETTSLNLLNSDLISIYPNPTATGIINLDFPSNLNRAILDVYDASGRLLSSGSIASSYQLPQHSGLYWLQVTAEDGILTKKIVVH